MVKLHSEGSVPAASQLSRVDYSLVKSGTTPCFKGSMSRLSSAPVHLSITSHAWPIHICNPEQLLVFGLYELVDKCTGPPVKHLPHVYAIRNNSLFLGLFRVGRRDSSEFPGVDDSCMQSGTTPHF